MRLPPRDEGNTEFVFYATLFAVIIIGGMVGAFIQGPKPIESKQEKVVEDDSCMLPVYSPICMSRNVKELLRAQSSVQEPQTQGK